MNKDILAALIEIITELIDYGDIPKITESSSLEDDLGVDEKKLYRLMLDIRDEWGWEVEEDDTDGWVTVGDVAAAIEEVMS